jgi:hypothetical protein
MVNILAYHHEAKGVSFFPMFDGYHIFNTHRIWFSQNRLQKVLVLTS